MAINRRNPSVMLDVAPPSPSPLRPVNTTLLTATTSPVLKATTTTTGSSSLFHTCRSILDRLACVEGMPDYVHSKTPTDPLSKLTFICRQGYPLYILYNALNPDKPLSLKADPSLNAVNSCKAYVYHFIVACKQVLLFKEEDMFSITDLYQNDTNGFVKVVNTVNKLLLLMEERGIIAVQPVKRNSDSDHQKMDLANNVPKNTRDKVVMELLETERKYVQDMEILQKYMNILLIEKIVSPDTIHYLFGNLNALVHFQRLFLLKLEEIAEKQPEEQRIGCLFLQEEESFCVYEPYCSNYYYAQDLVVQETPRLQQLDHILNPIYELPSLLIKPVQRICKYPLLLQELVRSTDSSWPYYYELQQGFDSIKRVAEKVNETQRTYENKQAVQELKDRLDQWRRQIVDGSGNLLLQDKLIVTSQAIDNSEREREVHVFCFDKAILFLKEKANNLSIKKKRQGNLVPKLIIQTSSIADVEDQFKNNSWWLQIYLQENNSDQLSIKFRNEEQVKLWSTTLIKASKKAQAASDYTLSTHFESPYSDFDDEEDELFDEDEEDCISYRSRSNSFSQQQAIRGKLGPIQSHDMVQKHSNTGRSYNSVPGMNLSPLPRSNSNLTYQYFPVSPPPSYPSSPTSSSRTSSNSGWVRTDGIYAEMASSLFDYSSNETSQRLLITGRSQSQSAASGSTRPALPVNQTRLRSQSSPNIMKNGTTMPLMSASSSTATNQQHEIKVPQVPMVRQYNRKPAPLDLSRQKSQIIRSANTTPRFVDGPILPPSPGKVRIKLNFSNGVYVIETSHEATFFEVMEQADKKLRLLNKLKQHDVLRLKYRDEEGDYITINSNDDIQMAFESQLAHDSINLYVSL